MTMLFLLLALAAPAPAAPAADPARPESWPSQVPLKQVSAPDWTDYIIYPEQARQLGQEGAVRVEALIGRNGVPRACRILLSSGHSELDSGTCALIMTMRFGPPVDDRGQSVETVFRTRIAWLLGEQAPLAAARLTASLTFRGGRASGCALEAEGAVPAMWTRLACRVLTETGDYYFGARRFAARRGRVTIELIPQGAEALPSRAETSPPIAVRRTEFEVDQNGDARNCRTTRDEGFGTPRVDHQGPCGFFVVKTWFDRASSQEGAPRAAVRVSVYVEEPKSRRR